MSKPTFDPSQWDDQQLLTNLVKIHDLRYMRHKSGKKEKASHFEYEAEIINECARRNILDDFSDFLVSGSYHHAMLVQPRSGFITV